MDVGTGKLMSASQVKYLGCMVLCSPQGLHFMARRYSAALISRQISNGSVDPGELHVRRKRVPLGAGRVSYSSFVRERPAAGELL